MVVYGGNDEYKCTWLKKDEAKHLMEEAETEMAHEVSVLSSMLGSFVNECEKINNKVDGGDGCLVVTMASIIADITQYAVADNTWCSMRDEITKSKTFKKDMSEFEGEFGEFFDTCRTNLQEVRSLAFDLISGISKQQINKLLSLFPLHLVCKQFASVTAGKEEDLDAVLKATVLMFDSICTLLSLRREFDIEDVVEIDDADVVFGLWCKNICKSLFTTYIDKFVNIFPYIFIMDGASLGKRSSFHTLFMALGKHVLGKKRTELETDGEKKAMLILEKYCGKDLAETFFAMGD